MSRIFCISGEKVKVAEGVRIIRRDDLGVLHDSNEIIEKSRNLADDIRKKAEEDYRLRYEEGFEKGQQEGKSEYTEKIMDLIISQVDSLAELENDMAQVVIDSVTKIIGELPDSEQIVRVVRKAINTVRGMKRVTVRVAPEDESAVRADLGMLLVSPDGRTGYIDLVADASMKHGDCILETPMGIINAGLEFQLSILKKSIQSRVQQNSAG
ncbi:HrpE/YscL family type III secretion apparatus protein [Succinimonas amylolytica]|uniref:HrpE/YscL family type III secretion apparatus protein n=1 Tax=Succinimonas amylolytica TaxID=83769 RepID=UPI00036F16E0|nr:HrpE/YscL family type III secretion apparatus protein [Succinimonas amylolytica]